MRTFLLLKRLALFFLLFACSIPAVAQTSVAPAAGDGSVGNPYQIATLENLYWFSMNNAYWGYHFKQTANINASATSGWNGGAGFPMIGFWTVPFSGTYNGQGFYISGLVISKTTPSYQYSVGFIGYLSGTVKNLNLYNVSVTSTGQATGGLVGQNVGTILNCAVTGTVSGINGALHVGGLVGYNGKSIDSCYSNVTVSGGHYVGGLAGTSNNSGYQISNSYAVGSVNGSSYTGGLIGHATYGSIVNCFSAGAVSSTNTPYGGLLAYTYSLTVTNSFWNTQTSGQPASAAGTGKTTSEMQTFSTFTSAGWNTASWGMSGAINGGYPYLRSLVTTPAVSACSPAMNARNVSASSNITIIFSEPIQTATFIAGTSVTIFGSISGKHSGSLTYQAGTMTATFNPASDFAPGEAVTVSVTAQVTNVIGSSVAPAVWHFTVQSSSSDTLGSLVNVATVPTAIVPVAADLDNDGDVDIATANYTANTVSVMLNSGSRTYAAPVPYTLASSVRSISSADVDNDGDMDLIAAVNNSTLAVMKNNGNGTFAAAVSYTVGQLPTFIAVADIDGDGDLDIASGNFDANTISVITNNGSGVFSASTNYGGLSGDHGVQFSDVDGDKDMDLIGAGYYSSSIGVYVNNGSGSFGSVTTYASGANPVHLRLADVDGDGDEDLFTANAGGNSVSVFMNNGNGTFAAKVDYAVGLLPYMTVPSDVDGDGDIDIAVACVNGLALNVLRNNGSGSFTVVSYPMGFGAAGVDAADMDGDGKLDLILSSHTDNLVKVLYAGAPSGRSLSFNGTDGYGKVAIPTPTAYTIEMWVKPADVTSRIIGAISDDTGPATSYYTHQISITSDHKFQHYLFDGSLRFVTGTTTVVADRWYHIAITATNNGQMRLFVNGVEEGSAVTIGTMTPAVNTYFFGMSSPTGSAYTGLMDNMRIWNYARSASQLSGALFTEISGAQSGLLANYRCSEPTASVAYDSSGNNRTLSVKGSGYSWSGLNFPPQPTVVSRSPAANANTLTQTGNIAATFSVPMDNATFIPGTTVKVKGSQTGVHSGTIAFSNGAMTMTFDPSVDFAVGEDVEIVMSTGIKSADDIALPSRKYWRMTVQGISADTLVSSGSYGVRDQPQEVALADLDGDGDRDMIVANYNARNISVLMNFGNGTFSADERYGSSSTLAYPSSVASADLDGDGDMDILAANSNHSYVSVILNNGNGTFPLAVDYQTGAYPYDAAAADVDGDGDVDVLVANAVGNSISVLKNNGNGTFAAKVDYAAGSSPYAIVTGDLDADGDIDVAVASLGADAASVLLNNGDGTFAAKVEYTVGDGPYAMDVADIDGDGDLDLGLANFYAGTVSILKNNSEGTFAAKTDYVIGTHPNGVIFSDVDGDGDRDMVSTNTGGHTLVILKNIGAGIFGNAMHYATGTNPAGLASADADNDGDIDIIVSIAGTNTVTVFNGSTFAALPVELTSFTAASRGSGVELRWSTATEVNNHGFEVERRAIDNGQLKTDDWSKAGFVEGSGTSNVPSDYSFSDRNISAGKYSYRLKQIDRDGKFEYSPEVEVTITAVPVTFELAQNFPNPFNPETTLRVALPVAGHITLSVYDLLGREVAVLMNEWMEAGMHAVRFNGAGLASGLYLARLSDGNAVHLRKMQLMK